MEDVGQPQGEPPGDSDGQSADVAKEDNQPARGSPVTEPGEQVDYERAVSEAETVHEAGSEAGASCVVSEVALMATRLVEDEPEVALAAEATGPPGTIPVDLDSENEE